MQVLPAHAGVILSKIFGRFSPDSITRTCGGDPGKRAKYLHKQGVLPAHAGVIPTVDRQLKS